MTPLRQIPSGLPSILTGCSSHPQADCYPLDPPLLFFSFSPSYSSSLQHFLPPPPSPSFRPSPLPTPYPTLSSTPRLPRTFTLEPHSLASLAPPPLFCFSPPPIPHPPPPPTLAFFGSHTKLGLWFQVSKFSKGNHLRTNTRPFPTEPPQIHPPPSYTSTLHPKSPHQCPAHQTPLLERSTRNNPRPPPQIPRGKRV